MPVCSEKREERAVNWGLGRVFLLMRGEISTAEIRRLVREIFAEGVTGTSA